MNNNHVLLQSGKGIGGIWRFFSHMLFPMFRKAAPALIKKSAHALKKLVKSPTAQDGLKQI